jgi:hypothetical protein
LGGLDGVLPIITALSRLVQLKQYVLDVLAYVSRLSQTCGIGNSERNVQNPRERLGEQCFPGSRWPDEQDVALLELDAIFIAIVRYSLVMVVDSNCKGTLGMILADYIIVEMANDLLGFWKRISGCVGQRRPWLCRLLEDVEA